MGKSTFERHNNIYHCRYCNIKTENKNRVCDEHQNTKKCKLCKDRLKIENFDGNKNICRGCLEKRKKLNEQKLYDKHKVKVICKTCKKLEIVYRRYINKPKIHICKECADKRNRVEGKLVQCPNCKDFFSFISTYHMKECCNMTYQEFLQKYGRNAIYSELYRNRLKYSNSLVDKKMLHDKLSKSIKKYNENNRDKILERAKNAHNSDSARENHRKGFLRYLANMTDEQKLIRSNGTKRSWQNEETRKKRLLGINKPESILARKLGGRNAAFKSQQNCPKISKPTLKLFEKLKLRGIKCELEYEFGFYHIDIAIPDIKIAIECDGDYWHGNPCIYQNLTKRQKDRQSRDKARNTYLTNRGWKVLRFWTSEIDKDSEKICNSIMEKI